MPPKKGGKAKGKTSKAKAAKITSPVAGPSSATKGGGGRVDKAASFRDSDDDDDFVDDARSIAMSDDPPHVDESDRLSRNRKRPASSSPGSPTPPAAIRSPVPSTSAAALRSDTDDEEGPILVDPRNVEPLESQNRYHKSTLKRLKAFKNHFHSFKNILNPFKTLTRHSILSAYTT